MFGEPRDAIRKVQRDSSSRSRCSRGIFFVPSLESDGEHYDEIVSKSVANDRTTICLARVAFSQLQFFSSEKTRKGTIVEKTRRKSVTKSDGNRARETVNTQW